MSEIEEKTVKICLILEGCYPYVFGGVSTWMHQYINEMKEQVRISLENAGHKPKE